MSDSKGTKKENLFAKLAEHNARSLPAESAPPAEPVEAAPPSPAPAATPKPKQASAKEELPRGKREHPDYCQANAYIPRRVRRAVNKALIDIEGLDYSSLVTDLLRQWLKARGVSE